MTNQDSELLDWSPSKTALQHKLGELVQYFQRNVPVNLSGLPLAYIDPTVITPYLLDIKSADDLSDDIIKQATIPISYEEGYPAVEGVPVWERLDGEPVPYYKLFKEYRELKYTQGTRSIAKLMETTSLSGRQLTALSRVWHWAFRVKAYDLMKAQEREIKRLREIESLNNKHSQAAEEMLQQAMEYLRKHPEQLTPKTAIQLADLAIKVGRLALGLNADKPGSGQTPSTNITIANTTKADSAQQIITVSQQNYPDNLGTSEQINDLQHLQDVLEILGRSGALEMAFNQQTDKTNKTNKTDDINEVNKTKEPAESEEIIDVYAETAQFN